MRKVPFNEAEFATYGGPGSSTVTGQLAVSSDEGIRYGDGSTVELIPVTAYTTEMVETELGKGLVLFSPKDPRFKKYDRKTDADHRGNFVFNQVPAGEYYLFGYVQWNDQDLFPEFAKSQWACERVTVGSGQTVRVMVTHNPNHSHIILDGF